MSVPVDERRDSDRIIGRALRAYADLAALLSRASGEAVKFAARLRLLAENEDLSDLDDCEKAADMLESLSASAARLTEERDEYWELYQTARKLFLGADKRAQDMTEDNKRLRGALERLRDDPGPDKRVAEIAAEALRLSPTASPPEGRTHKIVAGGPACPTCGFRIRIEEPKPFVFDDDEGAPADGAEESGGD